MSIKTEFYKPLELAFSLVKERKHKKISDWEHLVFGVERCIKYFDSGRGFVQKILDTLVNTSITVSNYFTTQKSLRRLGQVKNINNILIKDYNADIEDDPFLSLPCLDNYAIYAADGHYHKHASHDKHENGKNYPVGHVFAINLRNQTINHLDVSRPEDKKEHEIKTLKRLGKDVLRMGEPKGRRVAIIYDRAIVDFVQWYNWKQAGGIYIVTRAKKNMKLEYSGEFDFDKTDSINAGVISDTKVGSSKGTLIRRVEYYDSISGKVFVFLTNIFDVPPRCHCIYV